MDNKIESKSLRELTLPEENNEVVDNIVKGLNIATLIGLEAESKALLFNDGKERAYAQYWNIDHNEIWSIDSKNMTRWLGKLGMIINNGNIPTKNTISTAKLYLESAAFDGPTIDLHNRVAKSGDDIWYDLSNGKWQAIKINKHGWKVEDEIPPLFRRYAHQKPQLTPTKGGDVNKILKFINLPYDKKRLLLVCLISCFIPSIPHPVSSLFGPQGTGKSLLMEFLRMIIDPTYTPRLKMPTNEKDLVQNLDHHYFVSFDNLSNIKPEISDILCRAVTGESSEQRSLYSDDDAVIRSYRRCIMLTSINIAGEREDLLDRSIFLPLNPFGYGERSDESSLRNELERSIPSILGGILDIVVKAINLYPSVELDNLPRMADFAKWGYTIAEAIDGKGDEFLRLYESDINDRIIETIHSKPIAAAIIKLMKRSTYWFGTPSDLLSELNHIAETQNIVKDSEWPRDPAWLTKRIIRLHTTLEHSGIKYENSHQNGARLITLQVRENTVNTVIPSATKNDEKSDTDISVNSNNGKNSKNQEKVQESANMFKSNLPSLGENVVRERGSD